MRPDFRGILAAPETETTSRTPRVVVELSAIAAELDEAMEAIPAVGTARVTLSKLRDRLNAVADGIEAEAARG